MRYGTQLTVRVEDEDLRRLAALRDRLPPAMTRTAVLREAIRAGLRRLEAALDGVPRPAPARGDDCSGQGCGDGCERAA